METTTNTPEHIAAFALQAAQTQIGQQEVPKGSNRGPMVNKYLQSAGLAPGYAWCQAFVYWCYDSAAQKLRIANPAIKTGGVQDCWNKTEATHKILIADVKSGVQTVVPGDQFILLTGNGNGHTGIVEKVTNNALYTIEGNSNSNGSREGYEVVRHERSLNDKELQGFIRYA